MFLGKKKEAGEIKSVALTSNQGAAAFSTTSAVASTTVEGVDGGKIAKIASIFTKISSKEGRLVRSVFKQAFMSSANGAGASAGISKLSRLHVTLNITCKWNQRK